MASLMVSGRRLALHGVLFLSHPWKRTLAGLGLIAGAYAIAVWGWYSRPPELLAVQGRGLDLALHIGANAVDSMVSVASIAGGAGVVRGWQAIVPAVFLAGLATLVLPIPLQAARNRLVLGLTRGLPRQAVIVGDGGLVEAMILRCRADGQAVIRAVDEPVSAVPPALADIPQLVLGERWFEPICLDPRVEQVALLDPDSEFNLARAEHCLRVAADRARADGVGPLRLAVRVESARLRRSWAPEARNRAGACGLSLLAFSLYALQARALLRERGLDRLIRPGGRDALSIVIIGSGESVDELVTQIARLAHFRHPRARVCHIVGPDADDETERYLALHPGLAGVITLVPVALNPDAPDFVPALLDRVNAHASIDPGIDAVFLPGGGTSGTSQALAFELERGCTRRGKQPPPIHRLGDPQRLARGPLRAQDNAPALTVEPGQLLDAGLEMLLDEVPRAIHQDYLDNCLARGESPGDRPSLVPWDDLPADFVEDNRAQVDHFWIKARELDACLARGGDRTPAQVTLSAAEIEALAIAEHNRWWACRLSLGWQYAATRDDGRRLHPNMVAWEQLAEADREKDRDAVRQFPQVLAAHGYRLVRMPRVDGAADGSPRPGMWNARDGDRQHACLTVMRVADAASARRALDLIEAGEAVEVHLAGPLTDCTDGSRLAARRIAQGAWRVVLTGDASSGSTGQGLTPAPRERR